MSDPPSWLDEPCPRWCRAPHGEQDHPDDRRHRGEARHIEVLATTPTGAQQATELVVHLETVAGSRETTVRIEEAEGSGQGLTLAARNARLLATAITELLAEP